MTRQDFADLVNRSVVLLDGATGTEMLRRGMPRNVCVEEWLYEHQEPAIALQREYAGAGSQIVYAPTFGANRISLRKHGLSDRVKELNAGLVEMTRKAVGPDVFVAGDMTTPGEPLDPLGDLEEEELFDAYREQAEALAGAGADLIVAETLMAVREAEIALAAVRSVSDLPFMATLTVDDSGRAFFGGNVKQLVSKMEEEGGDAAGINCSGGPEELDAFLGDVIDGAKIPVIAKPNAGHPVPDSDGNSVYPMGEEEFAIHMAHLVRMGVRIVGGCCGTTPAYIRRLCEKIRQ